MSHDIANRGKILLYDITISILETVDEDFSVTQILACLMNNVVGEVTNHRVYPISWHTK